MIADLSMVHNKEEINIESDTIIESLNKGKYFSNIMIKVLNSMRKK